MTIFPLMFCEVLCQYGCHDNSAPFSSTLQALEELSFILTVVMDDLRLLSQLPALNLPHPLVPVLQAILSGRMPSRWWSGPSITLDEGLNSEYKVVLAH